ncbi:Ig-like domain-containing protein [Bacillus sp. UNCCL81]|uniref:fibronectin type III domain-containing protein n=1 Tax=Bacillus sp. UNCCL81 TaxID=1502755 RepID=UPI0008F259E9|nr:Ig-like domain-containing protein [Bacillus sp. UNCCL81]SFD77207.1 hypothetical protein SAMN02799633_04750 [Bacillus sp. UNCCL81]
MKKVVSAFVVILMLMFSFRGVTFAEENTIENGVPITNQIAKGATQRFEFSTTKDGEVYIVLDKTVGSYKVSLLDENENELERNWTGGSGDDAYISVEVPIGTYTIQVEEEGYTNVSAPSYRLKATYAASFTRNAKSFESNDTPETSMTVPNGEFVSSTAETELDKDVYQFISTKDGEVYLALDQTKGSYRITLSDVNKEELDDEYTDGSGDSGVIQLNVPKGKYYVTVEPSDLSGLTAGTYRLKTTYASSFTRNATSFEPNDTVETSLPITSNVSYSSTAYSIDDRDMYQLTSNKDGIVLLSLDKTIGSYWVELLDQNKNRIDSEYTDYSGENLNLEYNLQKGTYYVAIQPNDFSGITSGSYRIKATFNDKTPSIDALYDLDNTVKGSAVSGTKVIAVVGSTKLAETTAKDGKYSMTIPVQKAGTVIGVYAIDGIGNKSTTKTTTVVNATIKAGSSSYNSIKVSWNQMPLASGYEVYRSTSSTGSYTKVATVTSGSTMSAINTGVTTGSTYYYKVRPYNVVNNAKVYKSYSRVASGKAIPATPSGLTSKKVSSSSMTLSWKKVDGASGYKVYRSTSATGTYSVVGKITSGITVSFTNKSLKTKTTYYYKVMAYRTVGSTTVNSNLSPILTYKN